MINLYGKENCSRCEMVKNILTQKNIEFTYEILESLEENEKKEIMATARKKGMLSMPLIIKDGEMITIQEVKI